LSLPICSCCRCFDIASQHIYISRHVRFHDHVFSFYNSEQIAKVSTTPPALTATALLPNLLHSPLFPPIQLCHHNQPTRHSLHPSSHACLSNHSTAGSTCQLVSPSLQHATFAGVVKTGSSSASPYLANDNATAEFASAVNPIYADNSLLAADSPSAPSAGLNLVVAYPLQQDTSLPPSSPASPP
jgi:hypothetical protein